MKFLWLAPNIWFWLCMLVLYGLHLTLLRWLWQVLHSYGDLYAVGISQADIQQVKGIDCARTEQSGVTHTILL